MHTSQIRESYPSTTAADCVWYSRICNEAGLRKPVPALTCHYGGMKRFLVVALSFGVLTGCSPTISTNVTTLQAAPTTPSTEDLRVFVSPDRVERSYVEIAIVSAETYSAESDELIEALRTRARVLNADALILTNRTESNEGYYFAGGVALAAIKTVQEALAIIYTD